MIRFVFACLCLALSALCGSATWTLPKRISSNALATSYGSPTIISDPLTGTTHLLYCGGDHGLYYLQINAKGVATTPKNLHSEVYCYAISVAMSKDGKGLYVAEGATKKGIEDVWFLESKDSGNTWTVPAPIPREPQHENDVRSAPSVSLDPRNGRLWVFYARQLSPNDRTIFSATRSPGSSIFSLEAPVDIHDNLAYYVKSVFTVQDGKGYLHLLWSDKAFTTQNSMKHSVSTTNGLEWTKPTLLSNWTRCSSLYGDNDLLSLTYAMIGKEHWLKISKDSGKTWLNDVALTSIAGKAIASQCRCSGKHYIMLEDIIEPTKFGIVDDKGQFVEGPVAFKNLGDVDSPAMTCYFDREAKANILRAVAVFDMNNLYTTSIILQ